MARKVMLSLDEDLLASFDREVRRRRTTRSGLIQEGMRRVLARPDRATLERRLADIRGWADDQGGTFDAADTIRGERDWLDARDRAR